MLRLSLFSVLLLLSTFVQAQNWESEVRVGYLRPFDKDLRKIFPFGWVQYQFQAAAHVFGPFHLWGSGAIINASGHSLGLHEKTRLRLYPVGFGGYYKLCLPNLQIPGAIDGYLGLGGTYSFIRIHDLSAKIPAHRGKNTWGGVAKSGLRYHFCGCGYIGGFVDYYFSRFPYHDEFHPGKKRHVNVSGFVYGGSLGFSFPL